MTNAAAPLEHRTGAVGLRRPAPAPAPARTCTAGTSLPRLRAHRRPGSGRRDPRSSVSRSSMASIVASIRGSSAGRKPTMRHHQVRGVEVVGAERLGERAGAVAPALASGSPRRSRPGSPSSASTRSRDVEPVGQADGAVERDPAHQLGVQEVRAARRGPPRCPDPARCQRAAAASARSTRNRSVASARARSSWSDSRAAASSSSP